MRTKINLIIFLLIKILSLLLLQTLTFSELLKMVRIFHLVQMLVYLYV